MGKYQIFETTTFKEDLAQLDRAGLRRIQEKLETYTYPTAEKRPTLRPQYQATEELGAANLALPRWCLAILLRNQ